MICLICGSPMFGPYKGSADYYSYPGTHLWDIDVYKCKCGEEEYSLPQIAKLDELLDQIPTARNIRWTDTGWIVMARET